MSNITPGRILIVYGTRFGQTAKIAEWMGDVLRERGYAVTIGDAAHLPLDLGINDADGIIIGASVIFGRHEAAVRRFIRRHLTVLNERPSGFFSVSGSAGSPQPALREQAHRKVTQFVSSMAWRPMRTATIAGAMAYSRYTPLLRWVMRQIARRTGESTDSSQDHEYTDWHQVTQFADSVAASVAERRRTHVASA